MWRQVRNSAWTHTTMTTPSFYSVGPLEGGGRLVEVVVNMTTTANRLVFLALGLSGGRDATLASLSRARSLLEYGPSKLGGEVYELAHGSGGYAVVPLVFPVNIAIEPGGEWLVVGVRVLIGTGTVYGTTWCKVEVPWHIGRKISSSVRVGGRSTRASGKLPAGIPAARNGGVG